MKLATTEKFRLHLTLFIFSSTILLGCGGGGSPSEVPLETKITGYFKDSNVGGLSYKVVGSTTSEKTGTDGSYSCLKSSDDLTFSLGSVIVGTTSCNELTTPIDLVDGGSSTSTSVLNITRFLMLADQDNNPNNGIAISEEVQTLAKDWGTLDFGSASFDNNVTSIVQNLNSSSTGQHSLPTANEATQHLESTLLCAYSGAYKGSFNGGDNGSFGALISAESGGIKVLGYSNKHEEYFSGPEGSSFSKDNLRKVVGKTDQGSTFNGALNTVNSLSGGWDNGDTSGAFSANRIGGVANALYRFTGDYNGSTSGLFSFDIDQSNNITGVAYNVYEDNLISITGKVEGTFVTAKTSDGLTNITANFDTTSGQITNGFWKDTKPNPDNNVTYEGFFNGYGCKLN